MPITDTVRAILTAAAQHADHLAAQPERLPAAAQRAVAQSMLRAGLLEESAADDEQPAWRTTDEGQRFCLQATPVGLDAIGVPLETTAQPAPAAPARLSVRTAAQAVLSAWDDPDAARSALPHATETLRAVLTGSGRTTTGARHPRPDTKRAKVLGLLRRPEGTTVAQVVEATGWARHTVHGFFAGLKKAGTPIEVLERVRQVDPGKRGSAGSYTVYQAAGEAG